MSGVGAGPGVVTQATIGGVEFPDFTPDIRVSIRADSGHTAARSPPVCAAAIPNNRPRGPALNLTPAKNWPRRNYASHILYDNIMRSRTRHILQWKTKLPSKYSGGPSPQLYYGKVKVWVKGRLYKDLSFITILQGLWTCGHWPAPSLLKWVWWPDDTDDHIYLFSSLSH